jgi:hypothetical protein
MGVAMELALGAVVADGSCSRAGTRAGGSDWLSWRRWRSYPRGARVSPPMPISAVYEALDPLPGPSRLVVRILRGPRESGFAVRPVRGELVSPP